MAALSHAIGLEQTNSHSTHPEASSWQLLTYKAYYYKAYYYKAYYYKAYSLQMRVTQCDRMTLLMALPNDCPCDTALTCIEAMLCLPAD